MIVPFYVLRFVPGIHILVQTFVLGRHLLVPRFVPGKHRLVLRFVPGRHSEKFTFEGDNLFSVVKFHTPFIYR